MTTELAMTTWVVAFNDYSGSTVGGPTTTRLKIEAAYYAQAGNLIEFKGSDHQSVFAIHAGIVSTILRDGAAVDLDVGR